MQLNVTTDYAIRIVFVFGNQKRDHYIKRNRSRDGDSEKLCTENNS